MALIVPAVTATVADAVRFVSAGVSAPGINYVHTDHLGSPQKMTDASKAIVWDAVYTLFGQVHTITGTATNNQRFPGRHFTQGQGTTELVQRLRSDNRKIHLKLISWHNSQLTSFRPRKASRCKG